MSELEEKRRRIEDLDKQIFSLLNERFKIAIEIGQLKKNENRDVVDKDREKRLVEMISREGFKYLKTVDIHQIYEQIFSISRRLQGREIVVGYLGPPGTFSEQAARDYYRDSNATFVPYDTIPEVFRAVANNETNFGIVPVENTTTGTVSITLDLLIEQNIRVCGEIVEKIVQNLLAPKNMSFNEIKQVYSHPQSLSQCRNFLNEHLPDAELLATKSTVKAVELVRNMENAAAIGTELAARLYNLVILSRGIEDYPNNFTRFFILGKKAPPKSGNDKTSIAFTVKHEPGALLHALKAFSDRKINLTKLESRPLKSTPWEYLFITDFEGHIEDKNVWDALEAVKTVTTMLKIFGSYPVKKS
ncbi:MAG: prephenate dehydratase [Candidatus Helarchaeales archaeon]